MTRCGLQSVRCVENPVQAKRLGDVEHKVATQCVIKRNLFKPPDFRINMQVKFLTRKLPSQGRVKKNLS